MAISAGISALGDCEKNRSIRPAAATLGWHLGHRRGGKAPKVARGPQWAAATPNGANCRATP